MSRQKKIFLSILYIAWCGLLVNSFDRLVSGEPTAWYINLIIFAPVLALPFSIYTLHKQDLEVKKQYEEYLTEIRKLVNSIIDGGHINEIESSQRHNIIKWAERLNPSIFAPKPEILKDYIEMSIGGLFVGSICGGAVISLIKWLFY